MSYYVTYREDANTDEPTHNSIVALNAEEGTSTLGDIIGNCASLGCGADLYDAAGFQKGWVHHDGTYQLQ